MPFTGEIAPDFTLKGTTGEGLHLADLRGTSRALLLFYPKDKTSG